MISRFVVRAALLVLWPALFSHPGFAQPSGVLLGLQYEEPIHRPLPYYAGSADSLSRPVYQTLLVARSDDAFSVLSRPGELVVPRNNEFWLVGTKRSVYNNWVEDFIWAAPAGVSPKLQGIQPFNGEHCAGHRVQRILYAGPRYLSLDQRSAGYCEGATHPWFFNTLAVVPVDSTSHTGLSIDEVLGEQALETLENQVLQFIASREDSPLTYVGEPDMANWGLVREKGRWMVIARVDNAEEAAPDVFTDLALPFEVPAFFSGNGRQPDLWKRITAFAPDAVDALIAPEQDWLLILHREQLTIHPISDGKILEATLTRPLPENTNIVMARWVSDTRLHEWVRRFRHLPAPPSLP